jgi:endonuclease YncB( thermonuclease family)
MQRPKQPTAGSRAATHLGSLVAAAMIKPRIVFVCLVALPWQALSAPIDQRDVRVIDGDTIRVFQKQPNVRLVGFNAPETRKAQCNAERGLGARATRRVRDLVRGGNLDFEFVACSCPAGTEGTPACNYGRRCGTLKADGKDVGAILIAEGLAVAFQCGATSCPKTPRPWCEAPLAR